MSGLPELQDSSIALGDGVALLTFERDDVRNALTGTAIAADLLAVLAWAEETRDTSVLIITGAGKAFSAGGDIIGYKRLTTTDSRRDFIVDCMRAAFGASGLEPPTADRIRHIVGLSLVDAVDRLGLADNTFVIYMSDNGSGGGGGKVKTQAEFDFPGLTAPPAGTIVPE